MILTTTSDVQGRTVAEYLGIVSGQSILSANVMNQLFFGIRDIFGGRADIYEKKLRHAREITMDQMLEEAASFGADAIIGIGLSHGTVGTVSGGNMLMVTVSGTAVRLVND